jgi:spermidine dehydrogenase
LKQKDHELGLNCPITRRDLIHGLGAIAGVAMVPGTALADAVLAMETEKAPYPPALTGLRGNHDGSWEAAHALARHGKQHWPKADTHDDTLYDLVVVGAGISGLSAAHFWLKSNPDAKVLILDNHDDFGGHAKRNEFSVGGRKLIGYGGSQTLQEPSSYPAAALELLDDLGVQLKRFDNAYDQSFFRRNGLAPAIFFDQKNWGSDQLVHGEMGTILSGYLPLAPSPLSLAESIDAMPMSPKAKQQLLSVHTSTDRSIPGSSEDERYTYLSRISYHAFLTQNMGVTEPEVFAVLQDLASDFGVGIESVSAAIAILWTGLPGIKATGFEWREEEAEPYIHHFPDGNASIARLLVRRLIPGVAEGSTMEDIVTANFDYKALDLPHNAVRLRLNSTAIAVNHDGDPNTARQVNVTYVRDSIAHEVKAKKCILACYNAMIPALCPDLPLEQREALALQVKTPILYTSVALRNWQAWKKLGIGAVAAPSSYHVNAMLDFPVSLGDYQYGSDPEQPVIVHMERFPHRSNEGLSSREQHRLGRYELLSTPYSTIERNVREQLAAMLGPGGFDPARDILGITVNRWAHGYAHNYRDLEDKKYDNRDDERYPHVRARKPFGLIAIANSDAGARAMLEEAVVQGRRAVDELS